MRSVGSILESAAEDGRISSEEAVLLFEEADLFDLASCADSIRQRRHPDNVISYIIDRNINYTNICKEFCTFCAFYRVKGDPEAYVLPDHVIHKKIEETIALGGDQVLMQGGLHPSLRLEWYEELLRDLRLRYPQVNLQRKVSDSLPLFFTSGNLEYCACFETLGRGSLRAPKDVRSGFDAGRRR